MVRSTKRSLKLLALVFVLCYAVMGLKQRMVGSCDMENNIVKIREELRPLDVTGDGQYPQSVVNYFKFYGLDFENGLPAVRHIFGTFESDGRILAGHIFEPKQYKATVFVLHGYLNHCAQLKHLIGYLIEAGFAVATFDLPGHGLSGGGRGEIEDFSQYTTALCDFVGVVSEGLDGPYHVIGFSTGASAVLDYLFNGENNVFDSVVLAAPLVHCAAWEQSKAGFKLYSPFGDAVPRMPRKEPSDAQVLELAKKDPLRLSTVPLKWVKALYDWNDRIAKLPPCQRKVKVIQGTGDTTVDWKFNIDFIRKKFSDVEVSLIENAHHELFNEPADIRKEVFSQISRYLGEK